MVVTQQYIVNIGLLQVRLMSFRQCHTSHNIMGSLRYFHRKCNCNVKFPLCPTICINVKNGSVLKLAQIGIPFTLDLWIRTNLGLLSGPIWDRFPRCTHLGPCSFRSNVNGWNRSQTVKDGKRGKVGFVL